MLANIAAGSAAEYGLIGGDLPRSVGFMSLAMKATRRLSSPRWRLAALCTAGAIRHEMGRARLAKWHFDRALTLFEIRARKTRSSLGERLDSTYFGV